MPSIPQTLLPGVETQSTKLRKPQIAILKVLAEVEIGTLSRSIISELSKVALNTLCPMLGSYDAEARINAEARGKCKSLITLGYVGINVLDICGVTEYGYYLTPAGREAARELLKSGDGLPHSHIGS